MTDDARVERCRLAFVCGQRWDELERLPNHEQVRFCQRCQSSVHLAATPKAFDALAAQGRCVAIAQDGIVMEVGRPTATYRVLHVIAKSERDLPEGGGERVSGFLCEGPTMTMFRSPHATQEDPAGRRAGSDPAAGIA